MLASTLVRLTVGGALAVSAGCGGKTVVAAAESTAGSTGAGGGGDPAAGCEPGFATCGAAPGAHCATDLQSDEAQCGSCGHGCQGGHCQSGTCQPVVVVAGQTYAYRIAADETGVWWTTSDGTVQMAPAAAAGAPPIVLASGQNAPGDLVVDGTHVYWVDVGDGTILRAPKQGGSATVITSGEGPIFSLALGGAKLSWCVNDTGVVRSMALDGSSKITLATTQGAWGVAADASRVYWTTFAFGGVFSAPIGGGASAALTSGVGNPMDIVARGDRVYFDGNGGGVYAVPVGGGAPVTLAPTEGFGLAVDDEHVYYGAYDGRLMRVPVGGGSPTVIGMSPGFAPVTDIAVTSTSVYWTASSADGVILKVAK